MGIIDLTLGLLHHVDLDIIQDVDRIVDKLPFVVQPVYQMKNRSANDLITKWNLFFASIFVVVILTVTCLFDYDLL